jgi:ribosomal protein S27AE
MESIIWNVQPLKRFLSYIPSIEDLKDTSLEACMLLQITNAGVIEGPYRFVVCGSKFSLEIPADILFEEYGFHKYIFRLEFQASDILLQQNSLTSEWTDIRDLVNSKYIHVKKKEKECSNCASREFLAQLQERQKRHPEIGLSLRWALLITPSEQLHLALQFLPVSTFAISLDKRTIAPGFPTVRPFAWEIDNSTEAFSAAKGLKLILFAREPVIAQDNLARNPEPLISGKFNHIYIDLFITKIV